MITYFKYNTYRLWNLKNRVLMASRQVVVASQCVGVASQRVPVASQQVLIRYEFTSGRRYATWKRVVDIAKILESISTVVRLMIQIRSTSGVWNAR
jgi:hypothetical protein